MATIIQQAHLNRLSAQRRKPLDDAIDFRIRHALLAAEKKGKLDVVAAVTGLQVDHLLKIINSKESLTLMDRAMLSVHLS